jgi:hypothetical protein
VQAEASRPTSYFLLPTYLGALVGNVLQGHQVKRSRGVGRRLCQPMVKAYSAAVRQGVAPSGKAWADGGGQVAG